MDVPILVVSCDAYNDVWHPFFHCFFKNWRDCPFPIHLVSNKLTYQDSRVSSVLVGDDVDYSSNLINALHQIPQEWVIFWIDDRPPSKKVDTARIVELIEIAQAKDAGYFKLIPCNPPAFVEKSEDIGELPKGIRYRISMTVALWKKETLLKILQPGESSWDIEKRGGINRANQIDDKFYALPIEVFSSPPLQDVHLISKRKYIWRAINLLKRENISNCLEKRSKASLWKNLYFELYHLVWSRYYYMLWILKKLQKYSYLKN